MTLRSSDLQSDSDLDSIRNSCDVLNFRHMRLVWGIFLSKISRRRISGNVLKRGLEFAFTWDVITNSLQLSLNRLNKFKSWALLGLSIPFYFVDDMYFSRTQLKQGQIGLERSASWSLIPIHGPRGSRGRPKGSQGVKGFSHITSAIFPYNLRNLPI